MWAEGREVMGMGGGGRGREREKGREGGEKGKQGLAGAEDKPEVVRWAAGEAQNGASREVQAAMRARFSCS